MGAVLSTVAGALGAVIGGSAAYVAAAWKNRNTPGGQPQVQLGDELLQLALGVAQLRGAQHMVCSRSARRCGISSSQLTIGHSSAPNSGPRRVGASSSASAPTADLLVFQLRQHRVPGIERNAA